MEVNTAGKRFIHLQSFDGCVALAPGVPFGRVGFSHERSGLPSRAERPDDPVPQVEQVFLGLVEPRLPRVRSEVVARDERGGGLDPTAVGDDERGRGLHLDGQDTLPA
jgi:hypothetical protein